MRDDTLVLRLKAQTVMDSAATRLGRSLAEDPDVGRFRNIRRFLAEAPVRVEASPYDARELLEFKLAAQAEVFRIGAHWLDLDESHGVIRIGVEAPDDTNPVRGRVREIGIPDAAVAIEVRERLVPQEGLGDQFRPVPGGVRIDGYAPCTLTANAFMTDSEEWAFLTAAPCTSEYGASYGEAAYQNTIQVGNVIGWEILDPALFQYPTYGCPQGSSGCRYSDAALFVYQSSSLPAEGLIARTTNSSGSSTIDDNHPRFLVSSVSTDFPYEDMEVHKIGIGAGWTVGEVTNTCVSVTGTTDNIVRLCTTLTDYGNAGGDSGGPVFTWDGSSSYVDLVGVHWGGDGSTAAYTSWIYIQLEIEGELMEELIFVY
jgi:hypothetical protein